MLICVESEGIPNSLLKTGMKSLGLPVSHLGFGEKRLRNQYQEKGRNMSPLFRPHLIFLKQTENMLSLTTS